MLLTNQNKHTGFFFFNQSGDIRDLLFACFPVLEVDVKTAGLFASISDWFAAFFLLSISRGSMKVMTVNKTENVQLHGAMGSALNK